MENKIESSKEIEETGNYLQLFLYRAPKKNHDAMVKNLKQFVPWFKKHGARVEYYQLGRSETQASIDSAKQSGMDVLDSITKTLRPTKMRRKFGSNSNTSEITSIVKKSTQR